jgi:putative oxidoreductase
MTIMVHFSKEAIAYVASNGAYIPPVFVPLSGVIAIAGGLSISIGFKARWGAWLIVIFLIPVTFIMHAFWKETDPMQMQMQMGNFMKNISLLGAALMITYFGAGPLSVDAKNKKGA